MMNPSLISSKLLKPIPGPVILNRAGLIQQMQAALASKLTLVCAPAGWGKSTLLSSWAHQLSCPVAWLTLDEADREPRRWFTYVLKALQQAIPHWGEALEDLLTQDLPLELLLTHFVNRLVEMSEMEEVADSIVLILDDYHLIENPAITQAVQQLLKYQPHHFHLVLGTRSYPQLALSRLRAQGQLLEVNTQGLQFSLAETQQYFHNHCAISLSAPDIVALHQRTEGWITGLHLAALSLRHSTHPSQDILNFTGSHRYVFDYLLEEVLATLTSEERSFLFKTSILNRLHPDLCQAVTGLGSGLLETLERNHLFVTCLDPGRQTYRYHALFAEALRLHLHHHFPEEIEILHEKAAQWWKHQGNLREALHHATQLSHQQLAAEVLELLWPEMQMHYQTGTWLAWAQQLPTELLSQSPQLALALAWSLLSIGDFAQSTQAFQWAEGAARDGAFAGADPVQREYFRPSLLSARAYAALAQGNIETAQRFATDALQVLGPREHASGHQALSLLALTHFTTGGLCEAEQILSELIMTLKQREQLHLILDLCFLLGDVLVHQGKLQQAWQHYHDILERAEKSPHLCIGAEDLHRGLAEIEAEWGHFDTARHHLAQAETLGALNHSRIDWLHRLSQSHAQVALKAGQWESALAHITTAISHYAPTPLPNVRPAEAVQARIYLALGDSHSLNQARLWAQQKTATVSPNAWPTFMQEYLVLIHLQVASALGEPIDESPAYLAQWARAVQAQGRPGTLMQILKLQCIAMDPNPLAMPEARVALLCQLIEVAEQYRYRESLWGDPELQPLLRAAHQQGLMPQYDRVCQHQLAGQNPQAAMALPESLSPREIEVLQLMQSDLTGPQIANELCISMNTLRSHNKNIYGKLQVKSRRAALNRAKELQIL